MRKFILTLILVSSFVVLAIGTWVFVDNARGKQQWMAWKAARAAQGDHFEWRELVPPEVPDTENFAMAPLVAGAVRGKDMDPRFKALEPPKLEKEWGDWRAGQRADLRACAAAYQTQDLLRALAPLTPALRELDEASRRPHCRLPVNYAEQEFPSLLGFRSAVRTLRLRALVNLSQGRSEAALEDVLTCLRIADHLKAEPSLLASLLRNAILGLAVQPVWEGLLDHRWNEGQLSVLQEALQREDLLASTRLGFEGDRLNASHTFIRTAEGLPGLACGRDASESKPPPRLGWFAKRWFYRNILEIDRLHAAAFMDVIQPASHRVFPEKAVDPVKWLKDRRFRKDLILAQIAVPVVLGQVERAARLQSGLDQAAIACALERHRLATGAYPASLAELAPAPLTLDLVNGENLRYERRERDYLLYSVGWDRVDEGGRVVWNPKPKPGLDPAHGDWTWVSGAPTREP